MASRRSSPTFNPNKWGQIHISGEREQSAYSGAIQAALLLGRWTRITERHGGGCSCCPGLGDVAIDEVERRVSAWLAQRHPVEGSFSAMLRACISERRALPDEVQTDLDEALGELERLQAG
jgi:hypothetical protein